MGLGVLRRYVILWDALQSTGGRLERAHQYVQHCAGDNGHVALAWIIVGFNAGTYRCDGGQVDPSAPNDAISRSRVQSARPVAEQVFHSLRCAPPDDRLPSAAYRAPLA